MKKDTILYILLSGLLACSPSVNESNFPMGDLKYNLNHPDHKYFMDDDLEEISGLSYFKPDQLACIQDEEGRIFIFDLKEDKITQRTYFGRSGDYEGVEVVNDQIYAIRNDGKLFRFQLQEKARRVKAEEIDTPLSSKNDVEGLGYNPKSNQLLIACKAQGGLNGNKTDGKAIYAYDLSTKQLATTPLLVIDVNTLKSKLPAVKTKGKKDKVAFNPSGIAYHPKDAQFYILASEGKLLVVLNEDGSLANVVKLNPKIFKQPEGICFAPNGELFIASEGRGSSGYILRFKQQH